MQKVKIIRLKNLSTQAKNSIFEGQKESARLWNFCAETHKKARKAREKWPAKEILRSKARKLGLKMHSQSVQATISPVFGERRYSMSNQEGKQENPSSL